MSIDRRRDGRRGFTLLELLVVIFLIGLLVVAAFPFISQGQRDSYANSAARELWVDLGYARGEAQRTGNPFMVEICPGDALGGTTAPPGYWIIQCVPAGPGADPYADPDCSGVSVVCTEIQATGPTAAANNVLREVNLGQGGSTSLSKIDFGASDTPAGLPPIGTPYALTPGGVPPSGLDQSCDPTPGAGGAIRLFFDERGALVDDTANHDPCLATIYIQGSRNGDAIGNRAVEVTTVGTAKVYRWVDTAAQWR